MSFEWFKNYVYITDNDPPYFLLFDFKNRQKRRGLEEQIRQNRFKIISSNFSHIDINQTKRIVLWELKENYFCKWSNKKLTLHARKPDKTEEEEQLDACPYCGYQVPQTQLDCPECKKNIPYCIVTVSKILFNQW